VNPGGESGWDEPPLDIQIPDDARELDRDVLAYHRELRAVRRRNRMQKLAGQGTLMPLLASILAVCLVAGAMLSVATFSPTTPSSHGHPSATATSSLRSSTARSSTENSASASATGARPSGRGGTAQPSGAANSPAPSSPKASQVRHTTLPGSP
jgi:hypothetical protein